MAIKEIWCEFWSKIRLMFKPPEKQEVRCVWDLENEG